MSVPFVSPNHWVSLPSSLHLTFDHTSHMRESSINCFYLVIILFITGRTTPFTISSGSRGVSLTLIVLSDLSRNVLPTNWLSAALAMPAPRGLVDSIILLDLFLELTVALAASDLCPV